MSKITIQEIEQALSSAPGSFTVTEICAALGAVQDDELRVRVEREVESDNTIFCADREKCRKKADFFNGLELAITPDEWEINENMLIPANRFAPLIPENIFPSEVTLRDGDTELATREITAPLAQIFHYNMLLGSDQLFDFLLAESPANAALKNHAGSEAPVTLTVYDLKAFYSRNQFLPGDAIICRIEDYARGIFSLRFVPGDQRSSQARKKWITDFESGLDHVFTRFKEYLDIPDQLAWGLYYSPETIRQPECSFDEFTSQSLRLEITADGDHAVLRFRPDDPEPTLKAEPDPDSELPPGFAISSGETSDFAVMLREAGSPLAPVEVTSFMLDCCHARELDFKIFFSRAFGIGELKFADDGQEAIFMNVLEEQFEELTQTYNRYDDEPKAKLRESILDLIYDRLEFFQTAAAADATHLAEKPEFKQLSEIAMQLREILGMLNDPAYTPAESEINRLQDIIENRIDDQEHIIEILNSHLQE